jgi:hypothetical protein
MCGPAAYLETLVLKSRPEEGLTGVFHGFPQPMPTNDREITLNEPVMASVQMLSKVKNVSKANSACIFRVEKYLVEVISKNQAAKRGAWFSPAFYRLDCFLCLVFGHEVVPKNL